MSKQSVYIVTVIVCILMQAGIAPAISIMGAAPNFLLIPVLLIAMRSSTAASSIAGFLLGLLYDLMGNGTVGCMALVFTLIAFAVSVAAETIDMRTPVVTIIVSFIASFIVEIGYAIVAILTSSAGGGMLSTMLTYSLPSALYTAFIVIIALLTIGLVIVDENAGMPAHLGERGARAMRNMTKRKPRFK